MTAPGLKQRCLTNFLIRCCYWYYVKADPLITDYEYDMELKCLQKIEEETNILMKESPTQMIWGDCEDQYPEWVKETSRLKEIEDD